MPGFDKRLVRFLYPCPKEHRTAAPGAENPRWLPGALYLAWFALPRRQLRVPGCLSTLIDLWITNLRKIFKPFAGCSDINCEDSLDLHCVLAAGEINIDIQACLTLSRVGRMRAEAREDDPQ